MGQNRQEAMDELIKQAQELNMGYEQEPLSGDYQFNSEGRKQFHNLSDATTYLIAFGIKVFSIQAGYTQNGKHFVQVSYQRGE